MARRASPPVPDPEAWRIVEATLDLAEEIGWHEVRLYHVAERLEVPLHEIGARFRDLDAIANAWFLHARQVMLEVPPPAGASPPERLQFVIERWLDALAPRQEVTVEMLGEKLWPFHPHHWVPMVFDLSRLIHWFLDAARIASSGRERALAELGLTGIVLVTLRRWASDRSPGQIRAKVFLRSRLARADRRLGRLPRRLRA